jgi:hypothetical protein
MENRKAGVSFEYWDKLYLSLKKLLREVIRCHDQKMQLKNLGKVYAWFMRKLEAAGQISG